MEETNTQIIARRLRLLFLNEDIPIDPKLADIMIKIEKLHRELKDDDEIDDRNAEFAPH